MSGSEVPERVRLEKLRRLKELRAKASGVSDDYEGHIPAIPDPQHTPTPEPEPVPYGVGLASNALQGGSFGISDEAMAGLDAVTGGNYNPDKYRRVNEEFAEENPKAAFAAQLAGGIGTGGVGAAKVLGSQVVKGMGRMGKAAATTGVGGVEGAIAGAGYAKEGERLEGMGWGSVMGAGTGATLPAGALAGKAVWDYGLGQLMRVAGDRLAGASTVAGREVMRALDDAGLTLNQAISRLRALGKDSTLSDIIPQLGETAASVGGRATNAAERVYNQRVAGQADRVADKIDELLTNVGMFSEGAKVTARRAAQAKSAYKEAYEATPRLYSNAITDLLDNPVVKAAIRKAKRVPKYKDLPDNSMEILDQVYKQIGKKAHRSGDYLDGLLAKDLRAAIVAESPAYERALIKFADDSLVLDAMEEGKKLFRLRPEQIKKTMAELGETEAEAFRVGGADAIKDKILSAPDAADVVKRIFGSPKSRAQIRNIFPDRRSYRAFELEMKREALKAKTAARVLANSATARRQAGQAHLGDAPGGAVHDLITGHPFRAAGKAVGGIIQKAKAPNRKAADELASVLYNRDMVDNWDYLVRLGNKYKPNPQLPKTTQALANALMGGAAVQR